LGLLFGHETFNYTVTSLSSWMGGQGFTVGAYIAHRFGDIRVDAAGAWSTISYSVTSGSASGSIPATRWLGSVGLTGSWHLSSFVLEPSARVYLLAEQEQSWIDSLNTQQPARDMSSGRASFGSRATYSFVFADDDVLSPYLGFFGDYVFMSDNAVATGQPVAAIQTGWAGRLTGGLTYTSVGGASVSFEGQLGGLGANYTVWTGMIRGRITF